VLIYAVGLLTEEERNDAKRARRELLTLTEATGGEAFFPRELTEVDQIAKEVARDIRSQYTIVYRPAIAALDGTFREIKITVNAPGHPAVRTRSGYYATPDQAAGASK
jgi:VWFA-related protein